MLMPHNFQIIAVLNLFDVPRPHAECGAGAGKAIPGREAHGPGGAEDDVRA